MPGLADCVPDANLVRTAERYHDLNKHKSSYKGNWLRVLKAFGATTENVKAFTGSEAAVSETVWRGWRAFRIELQRLEKCRADALAAQDTAPPTDSQAAIQPAAAGVTINSFISSATSVVPGGSVTLSWVTTNADTVRLDGSVVFSTGSRTVAPSSTTTYTLTASNSGGAVSQTLNVVVAESQRIQPAESQQQQVQIDPTATYTLSFAGFDGRGAVPEGQRLSSTMTFHLTLNYATPSGSGLYPLYDLSVCIPADQIEGKGITLEKMPDALTINTPPLGDLLCSVQFHSTLGSSDMDKGFTDSSTVDNGDGSSTSTLTFETPLVANTVDDAAVMPDRTFDFDMKVTGIWISPRLNGPQPTKTSPVPDIVIQEDDHPFIAIRKRTVQGGKVLAPFRKASRTAYCAEHYQAKINLTRWELPDICKMLVYTINLGTETLPYNLQAVIEQDAEFGSHYSLEYDPRVIRKGTPVCSKVDSDDITEKSGDCASGYVDSIARGFTKTIRGRSLAVRLNGVFTITEVSTLLTTSNPGVHWSPYDLNSPWRKSRVTKNSSRDSAQGRHLDSRA